MLCLFNVVVLIAHYIRRLSQLTAILLQNCFSSATLVFADILDST